MTPTRQATVTINNQTFNLLYPDQPAVKKVVQEVFVKGEYPFLPFLQFSQQSHMQSYFRFGHLAAQLLSRLCW